MTLDQRLTDAARHVAQHLDPPEVDLEAVRSRAHASRRRAAAIALTAAVATAALVGRPLLDSTDSTAPRPATSPTIGVIRTLGDTSCDMGQCLEPGTYAVELGRGASGQRWAAALTVREENWESDGFQHRILRQSGSGAVVLNVYRPYELAGDRPCDAEGATTKVEPDDTVDDVAGLLASLEQLEVVDGPRVLKAFGRDARYLQVRADRLSCPGVADTQYNLADIYGGDGVGVGGDSDVEPSQSVQIQFWVVDLDGRPIVVEARQEGSPDEATVLGLQQLRDSVTFVMRR